MHSTLLPCSITSARVPCLPAHPHAAPPHLPAHPARRPHLTSLPKLSQPSAQVLPTSSRTALIEMVPNAPSIHALKSKSPPGTRCGRAVRGLFFLWSGSGWLPWLRARHVMIAAGRWAGGPGVRAHCRLAYRCAAALRCQAAKPNFSAPPTRSLRDHLAAKCGGPSTPAFQAAQRAFVESLAAYSLLCYLLQIKDRCAGRAPLRRADCATLCRAVLCFSVPPAAIRQGSG